MNAIITAPIDHDLVITCICGKHKPNPAEDQALLERLFLEQSNEIEDVFDEDSLKQAERAWKYLKSKTSLTLGDILKAHKILMLHQPLKPNEKGFWRQIYVQVGDFIAPDPHMVPSLMSDWLFESRIFNLNDKVEEEHCRKMHIKFEKIHPFVDGNGRIGRMLFNWMRLKHELPLMIIFEQEKNEYYKWFAEAS